MEKHSGTVSKLDNIMMMDVVCTISKISFWVYISYQNSVTMKRLEQEMYKV